MGLLYYIPNRTLADCRDPAALGLGHAADGPATACEVGRNGPDGGRGVVLAWRQPGELVGVFPGQTWREVPWLGLWIGWAGTPPGPEQLARPKQLRGHWVDLADGRPWLTPVARGWVEEDEQLRWYIALPRRSTCDPAGAWQPGPVVERYAGLWALGERWLPFRLAVATGSLDAAPDILPVGYGELHDAAAAALGENYRIGKAECAALGLLTEEAAWAVLDAVCDWPTRLEWLKKKLASVTASTAAGGAALTAATGRP